MRTSIITGQQQDPRQGKWQVLNYGNMLSGPWWASAGPTPNAHCSRSPIWAHPWLLDGHSTCAVGSLSPGWTPSDTCSCLSLLLSVALSPGWTLSQCCSLASSSVSSLDLDQDSATNLLFGFCCQDPCLSIVHGRWLLDQQRKNWPAKFNSAF